MNFLFRIYQLITVTPRSEIIDNIYRLMAHSPVCQRSANMIGQERRAPVNSGYSVKRGD